MLDTENKIDNLTIHFHDFYWIVKKVDDLERFRVWRRLDHSIAKFNNQYYQVLTINQNRKEIEWLLQESKQLKITDWEKWVEVPLYMWYLKVIQSIKGKVIDLIMVSEC